MTPSASSRDTTRSRRFTRLAMLGMAAMLAACGGSDEGPRATSAESATASVEKTVPELVEMHCVRCHLAPDPTDLSREYWSYALHYMGNYVGMKGDEFEDMRTEPVPPQMEPVPDYTKRYFLYDDQGYFRDLYPFKQYIPAEPLMSKDEWLRMREYYLSNSRPWTEMEKQEPKPPVSDTFEAVVPNLDLEPNALVIATLVDPGRGRIYVGRSVVDDWVGGGERREGFEDWDDMVVFDLESGDRIAETRLGSDAIDMALTETGMRLVEHGRFPMSRVGIARISDWEFEGGESRARMLVNGKQRFVQHHNHDMNGDGLVDIVANAFGDGIFDDAKSELTIFYQTPEFEKLWQDAPAEIPPGVLEGALRESILSRDGGMIGSTIADFDGDGDPDIAAVVAQGHQELQLYINNGDETYTKLVIDENTPSWGGNSLRAADFDGDGDPDLVVINGDNVAGNGVINVVPAPRPQHGIRVWRNDGNLKFSMQYYRRMHGAIRSVVHDFDDDGDMDIAAIALFPQWTYDEPETFVYLENQGGFRFEPQSVPREFFGVWASIEAADVNGDDKTDIVLGLGNYPELVPPDWITGHKAMEGRGGKAESVIYLLNQT
ncbi:MAG: FG-GAP repeat domain-containing protein [Woeseiaceae bacterium]